MVERFADNEQTEVQFFQAEFYYIAILAQLVEHWIEAPSVESSTLSGGI